MTPTAITILGPTATGKSALAVALAARLKSCVISGDAYQIYRGMDIGTAKITKEEMCGVPHYLVDEMDPEESYSAALFCQKAKSIIAEENAKGKVPVICGGTGLYIQSLLEGYSFLPKDEDKKSRWQAFHKEHGTGALAEEIRKRAPDAAIPIDPQRRIRLLELIDSGNFDKQAEKSRKIMYNGAVIGIAMERPALYARIDRRVDAMIAAGLAEEVRALLAHGLTDAAPAMRAIGYKEMAPYLRGECTLADAADLIKKNTRHFAKRQITWYRRMPYITWTERNETEDPTHWTERTAEKIFRETTAARQKETD